MAERPLLQVESLSKRFAVAGRRGALLHAVDDVSLSIAPGEALGLVGESGCGKSTLVRLLARLLDPSEGRIVFDGEDLAAIPARGFARRPERAVIQMVFQDPTDSLNPRFSARDTIREPCLLLAGMDRAAADARVDEVAQQVGPIGRADAAFVKQQTGFSIGGVSPVAHTSPPVVLVDQDLFRFPEIWAAAGHPNGVFCLRPDDLLRLTGAPAADVVEAA